MKEARLSSPASFFCFFFACSSLAGKGQFPLRFLPLLAFFPFFAVIFLKKARERI